MSYCRLGDTKKSESEQQTLEIERADKSMFVQELLLALLAVGKDQQNVDYKALLAPVPTVTVDQHQTSESKPLTQVSSTSDISASSVVQNRQQEEQQQQQQHRHPVTECTLSNDHPLATAPLPHVGRSNLHASSNAPPLDSRILSHSAASLGSRAVTKRKSVTATNTTKASKETTPAAATAPKRH